jgi:hypothetical protein
MIQSNVLVWPEDGPAGGEYVVGNKKVRVNKVKCVECKDRIKTLLVCVCVCVCVCMYVLIDR